MAVILDLPRFDNGYLVLRFSSEHRQFGGSMKSKEAIFMSISVAFRSRRIDYSATSLGAE